MKRDEWAFEYPASDLAAAASAQKEKHERKREWWETKKNETMAKVKDGGISVHDSVASDYSNTKGLYGPEIKVDASLERDLKECQSKINAHHAQAQNYNGWHQVLTAQNPASRHELHHDDWLFFFGE